MLPSSKLNFAAWTGLGITALFGGTGIYLVRNSQNLGKQKGEKDQELNHAPKKQVLKEKDPKPNLEEENSRREELSTSRQTDPQTQAKEERETLQEELALEEEVSAPDSLEDKDNIEKPTSLETENPDTTQDSSSEIASYTMDEDGEMIAENKK